MSTHKTVSRSEEINRTLRTLREEFRKDIETMGMAASRKSQELLREATRQAGEFGRQCKQSIDAARAVRDKARQEAGKAYEKALRAAQSDLDKAVHAANAEFAAQQQAANDINTASTAPVEAAFKAQDEALAAETQGAFANRQDRYNQACAPLQEELATIQAENEAREAARLAKLAKEAGPKEAEV
jgi:hypothetical protein